MRIQFLQHKDINKTHWNETIRNSANGLLYARSLYLDSLCPGWNALVTEDYSFVMPLTHKTKFGIRYLYQPPFCQQLGIFGTGTITEAITGHFITECRKAYAFGEIYLNHQNVFSVPSGLAMHKNYILNLGSSYAGIKGRYTNDLLKKNLSRTEKFNLQYTASQDIDKAIGTFQELYASRTPHVSTMHYQALAALAKQFQLTNNVFVREVSLPNGELLACGLFLKDEHRIYNIASSTLPNGRTFEANHFLFDQLIQEFAGTGLLLDFEGSDIPGIERFYKKFGAVNEPYYFLKWNELPWPARWLKK